MSAWEKSTCIRVKVNNKEEKVSIIADIFCKSEKPHEIILLNVASYGIVYSL